MEFSFKPVAYVRTNAKYRFEAPRQAVFSEMPAFLEFVPGGDFALAAEDLRGFERIWVIFCFHENFGKPWKPKVRPPVSPDGGRYGVFATRSPHRPNPIGLSCVELVSVEKTGLAVRNSDMRDGTPVLDIKPYIPEADAFPASKAGWRDRIPQAAWTLGFRPEALERMGWILERQGLDLKNFCEVQMRFDPLDSSRRRVSVLEESAGLYALGCRTWRIVFHAHAAAKTAEILTVESNYAPEELLPGVPDPYSDKAVHRAFVSVFGINPNADQSSAALR